MITAEQARNRMPQALVKEALHQLNGAVSTAAAAGRSSCRVPNNLVTPSAGGNVMEFAVPGVAQELEKLGYRITHGYEERQFVDLWLEIHWDETPSA